MKHMLFPLFVLMLSTTVSAVPVVFESGGSDDAASIQATVDAFRTALGAPNNANNPGPLLNGRREINWDGGGSTANAPGGTPFNVFRNNRGGQFMTPDGTGFIQAPASGGSDGGLETFFGNATYGATFNFFSPTRLFTPVDSIITDALFFIPGTNGGQPATVSGFGAVFTDVDLPNSAQLEFFGLDGSLLYQDFVPVGTVADQSLSFLGVVFNAGELISRVRIATGTDPLSATNNDGGGIDLVVLDDVLYSEPQAVVPEPATWALFGIGLMALVVVQRYRRFWRV